MNSLTYNPATNSYIAQLANKRVEVPESELIHQLAIATEHYMQQGYSHKDAKTVAAHEVLDMARWLATPYSVKTRLS